MVAARPARYKWRWYTRTKMGDLVSLDQLAERLEARADDPNVSFDVSSDLRRRAEDLMRQFYKSNPAYDPADPPKDPYDLALAVLRMNLDM